MRKLIITSIILVLCLITHALADHEAVIKLDIETKGYGVMSDIAATSTRFYLAYSNPDPELEKKSDQSLPWLRKIYVFDHEGTRRLDEEFDVEKVGNLAVTDRLIYVGSHAYAFDGTRIPTEDLDSSLLGSMAATDTHLYVSKKNAYIYVYKFKQTPSGLSFEKRIDMTTFGGAYIAATDTRIYIKHADDSTIYVYDTQDGGRRAREDFNNGLWKGIRPSKRVPSKRVSGITTTPSHDKLFLLISELNSSGKGYHPVVYRYSIEEEDANRPVVNLPTKPHHRASYYFTDTSGGGGIALAATDTTVYIAGQGVIAAHKYSDGVPGSLFADAGQPGESFRAIYNRFITSLGMAIDYHNIYVLDQNVHDPSRYKILYCTLNEPRFLPAGVVGGITLRDLKIPFEADNFEHGSGLAIDAEGILYVIGAGGIYRYKPRLTPPDLLSRALSDNPISLHPDHKSPRGITIVKNRAYIVGSPVLETDANYSNVYGNFVYMTPVYVYALDGTNGFEYMPEESFTFNTGILGPSSIAVNGDTFFILKSAKRPSFDKEVHVYGHPAPPSWASAKISDKYSTRENLQWIFHANSEFLFGNPEPIIAFKEGYTPPGWLKLNNGIISGTPESPGEHIIELTASNEHGSANVSFIVNVEPEPMAPVWKEISIPQVRIHDAWTLSLTELVSYHPRTLISFTEGYTPPDWLELKDGVLSGTPTTVGTFAIKLTATLHSIYRAHRKSTNHVIELVVVEPTFLGWKLDTLNDTAQGIAATNNRIYITDLVDDKIYVYTHNGDRHATEDIDLNAYLKNPIGIAATTKHIYIVDNRQDNITIFNADKKVYVGNINLHPDNKTPTGIAATTTRLYVVDNRDDQVFVYAQDGTPHSNEDIDLNKHSEPVGITVTNNRLYIVDSDTDKIYPYMFDGTMLHGEIIDLVTDNGSPSAITATQSHLLVVDIIDQKVYSYPIHGMEEISESPQDINGDGSVNIQDLVLVASKLGEAVEDDPADVNEDGVINIQDLVIVANALRNN